MDPPAPIATAVILALCLFLIVVTYRLGVEVGQAAKLRLHPGYEASYAASNDAGRRAAARGAALRAAARAPAA